ncbi:neuronal PAS domain-containing protein 2-like [Alligator sinensis]|uniref:Neuronal PAS domain-containing protein 2-like n=1 Tax=Alligator sinensis TaxID=38654 RepID=A0A3Q0FU71_ALLSI|nr:neuronal PAS domain-containing protein 2-like [Alligator sinensis]
MAFSQTHPITTPTQMPAEISDRQPQSDYGQDRSLRMLLDQPIQAMMPSANGTSQSGQNNAGRQQGKFVPEQQMLPPQLQMPPVTCSTVRAPGPSPAFSPSMMIPHTNFTSHQTHPPVHLPQWPQQQVQQHHLYLQMQTPESVQGSQGQRIFQSSHLPQQNSMGYFLHPQQQACHAEGQPCNLQDLPEMQLP